MAINFIIKDIDIPLDLDMMIVSVANPRDTKKEKVMIDVVSNWSLEQNLACFELCSDASYETDTEKVCKVTLERMRAIYNTEAKKKLFKKPNIAFSFNTRMSSILEKF